VHDENVKLNIRISQCLQKVRRISLQSLCRILSDLDVITLWLKYRGVDKSLVRPERKQATATEDFEFHVSYL